MVERVGYIPRYDSEPESEVYAGDPQACLDLIDDITRHIYLPFRGTTPGTERAILPASSCVEHRENDAEHTFHIATIANQLWVQRDRLGLIFPDGYDPLKALSYVLDHDVPEVYAPDVDSMTRDPELKLLKPGREQAAAAFIRLTHPSLAPIADNWERYERKNQHTPGDEVDTEARFVNDLDKLAPIRVICADGGRRWHDWEGTAITRTYHERVISAKLLTQFGHDMMDVIQADLDGHPEYFPEVGHFPERLF